MPKGPSRYLPLRIGGERATAIIEQVVEERLGQLLGHAKSAYPDGMFPGQKKLAARERLARYVLTTQPADVALLEDENYLDKWRLGALPLPQSPYWQNLMAVPDAFNEIRRDFLRLLRASSRDLDQGEEEIA